MAPNVPGSSRAEGKATHIAVTAAWAREVSRANVLLSLPRLPRVQLWPVLVSPASGPGSAVWGGQR